MTEDPLPLSADRAPGRVNLPAKLPEPPFAPWLVRCAGLAFLVLSAGLVFFLGSLATDDPDAIRSKKPIAYGVGGLILGLVLTISGRDPWTLARTYDRLPWTLRALVALVVIGGLFTLMALFLSQHI